MNMAYFKSDAIINKLFHFPQTIIVILARKAAVDTLSDEDMTTC
jgi:hypothetical protein